MAGKRHWSDVAEAVSRLERTPCNTADLLSASARAKLGPTTVYRLAAGHVAIASGTRALEPYLKKLVRLGVYSPDEAAVWYRPGERFGSAVPPSREARPAWLAESLGNAPHAPHATFMLDVGDGGIGAFGHLCAKRAAKSRS
jgi:hypothetical protein